jgi:hypothetical protein
MGNFPPLVPNANKVAKSATPKLTYSDAVRHSSNSPLMLEKLPVEVREVIWEARLRDTGAVRLVGSLVARVSLWGM